MEKLLPRHAEIIKRIDAEWRLKMEDRFAWMKEEEEAKAAEAKAAKAAAAKTKAEEKAKAKAEAEADEEEEEEEQEEPLESEYEKKVNSLCIIQENQWNKGEMLINMAYMAVIGSSYVNGVAAIHSDIIKNQLFKDFSDIWPEKFQNKTNGVTPRRWLAFCNPALSDLITETLGTDAWLTNKQKLAAKIKDVTGVDLDVNTMFDVQVWISECQPNADVPFRTNYRIKRIHQYKRQLMNIMSIIYRYDELKKMTPEERAQVTPRSCIIGGKAASAYDMAKRIVRLADRVATKINADPDTNKYLKLVFIPDYNVSWAEALIPGAELSQHISTAGTEASGTSNMKFQMNGSLIIGTMDGANIEIAEESGPENMFIFGVLEEEVPKLRQERVKEGFPTDPRFDYIINMIADGTFGSTPEDQEYFKVVADDIGNMKVGNDWFLVAPDFASYLDAQAEADKVYKDQDEWTKRSILYTAGSAKFSSDRTIA
eukprot:scaffold312400_cov48-Prasinocladus_malaysianus.AAC.1